MVEATASIVMDHRAIIVMLIRATDTAMTDPLQTNTCATVSARHAIRMYVTTDRHYPRHPTRGMRLLGMIDRCRLLRASRIPNPWHLPKTKRGLNRKRDISYRGLLLPSELCWVQKHPRNVGYCVLRTKKLGGRLGDLPPGH